MEEKFLCGVILGMVGGAVLVANSNKAKQLVKDSQQQVQNKIKDMTSGSKSKKSQSN